MLFIFLITQNGRKLTLDTRICLIACSEVKIEVLANHFQTSRSVRAKSTIRLCGID